MRVVGIDPGLQRAGYACIDLSGAGVGAKPAVVEAGVFAFAARAKIAQRLVELETDLAAFLNRCTPDLVCVEAVYSHYAFPRTAITMAHARGVILLVAHRCGVRIQEIPSTHAKKAVTGNGHASKVQIQSAVQLLLGLGAPPQPADVADAMAIALAGAQMSLAEGVLAEQGESPPAR